MYACLSHQDDKERVALPENSTLAATFSCLLLESALPKAVTQLPLQERMQLARILPWVLLPPCNIEKPAEGHTFCFANNLNRKLEIWLFVPAIPTMKRNPDCPQCLRGRRSRFLLRCLCCGLTSQISKFAGYQNKFHGSLTA